MKSPRSCRSQEEQPQVQIDKSTVNIFGKPSDIFNADTMEDLKCRYKFCNGKEVSAATRQMGIQQLSTPPPPPFTSDISDSDSGTSFCIIADWDEEAREEEERDFLRTSNIIIPEEDEEEANPNIKTIMI